jgi:integrase
VALYFPVAPKFEPKSEPTGGAMQYIIKLNSHYYFNRRVPIELREFDTRHRVRFSLKTDSRKEAARLAVLQNDQLENYWKQLVTTGKKHCHDVYEGVVKRAKLYGFGYLPQQELALAPTKELIQRLVYVEKENFNPAHVEAVLGGVSKPEIRIDDAFIRFLDYSKGATFNKSPNQMRKWKNPRKRAIHNLISVIGNKPLTQVTRDDILKFRDWWLLRIQSEKLGTNGANKNFIQLKMIFQLVNENLNLNIDVENLFKKILLNENEDSKRLPFETDYIIKTLLKSSNLSGLNAQAKAALYIIAETGAGLAEQIGLTKDDIILDAEIPHIIIRPGKQNGLKTKYRKRIIPLVGYALDALKELPNGLTDYKDSADRLSAVLGKFLRENNLLPSEYHTVYSLRHSFQDRLLAVNAPDRVQADLMGHKFNRQSYGKGASLEQKFEWMKKVQLK